MKKINSEYEERSERERERKLDVRGLGKMRDHINERE